MNWQFLYLTGTTDGQLTVELTSANSTDSYTMADAIAIQKIPADKSSSSISSSSSSASAGDRVDLKSITVSCNTVIVDFNKTFAACAHMLNANNLLQHSNNVFCSMNGPLQVPFSEFKNGFTIGSQAKLCNGNNYSNCSNLVTVTGNRACSSPSSISSSSSSQTFLSCPQGLYCTKAIINNSCTAVPVDCGQGYRVEYSGACGTTTCTGTCGRCVPTGSSASSQVSSSSVASSGEKVELTSVAVSCNTVTVQYSKSFDACAHMWNSSNVIQHTNNVFCNRNGPLQVSFTEFKNGFDVGSQVRLCHANNSANCSNFVTVSGNRTCSSPGSVSSSSSSQTFLACPQGLHCTKQINNNSCTETHVDCGQGYRVEYSGTCGTNSCAGACGRCVPTGNSSSSVPTKYCGDKIVQPQNGEQCDDGNAENNDYCAACKRTYCGDGMVQTALQEQCDDYNRKPGDGCSASCKHENCGDGVVSKGEECDRGMENGKPFGDQNAACNTSCKWEYCGQRRKGTTIG